MTNRIPAADPDAHRDCPPGALRRGVPALGLRHVSGLRELCQTRRSRRGLQAQRLGNVPRSRTRVRAEVRKEEFARLASAAGPPSLSASRRSHATRPLAPRCSPGWHFSIKRYERGIKACRLLHQRTQFGDARIDLLADVIDQIGHCAAVLHAAWRRRPLVQASSTQVTGVASNPRLIRGVRSSPASPGSPSRPRRPGLAAPGRASGISIQLRHSSPAADSIQVTLGRDMTRRDTKSEPDVTVLAIFER